MHVIALLAACFALAAARVLPASHHTNWLANDKDTDTGMQRSGEGVVDWYNAEISNAKAQNLVEKIQGNCVRYLSIGSCTVGTVELSKLLGAALYNTSQLQYISLRHCHLDAQVLSLAQSMQPPEGNANTRGNANTCLRVLDASFNSCLDSRAIKLLCNAVTQASALTTLVLDGNALSPEDVRAIVHAIRRHPSVTSLSLSSCSLSDASTEYLAFLLKSNRNITSLDLSCNAISQRGLEMIAGTIRAGAGRALVSLDLSYNALGDLGAMTFASAFECNQLASLKYLSLRETQAGSAALTALLSAVHEGSALECLDISGNVLFAREAKPKAAKGAKKISEMAAKSLAQIGSSITPAVNQAVESSMQLFKDLGAAVTDAYEGGACKKGRKALRIGYMKRGGAGKGAKGVKERQNRRRGPQDVAKGGVGRKSRNAAKPASGPEVSASSLLIKKQQSKLLARSRTRAMSALLAAARTASHLKVLGLVGTGLTDEAGKMLLQATRSSTSSSRSSNITSSSSNNSTDRSSNITACGVSVGLPQLEVLLELNELTDYGQALIESALATVRGQAGLV